MKRKLLIQLIYKFYPMKKILSKLLISTFKMVSIYISNHLQNISTKSPMSLVPKDMVQSMTIWKSHYNIQCWLYLAHLFHSVSPQPLFGMFQNCRLINSSSFNLCKDLYPQVKPQLESGMECQKDQPIFPQSLIAV